MRRAALALALLASGTVAVHGQAGQHAAIPAFEAASIKPVAGQRLTPTGPISPDRFYRADFPLRVLIRWAYDLPDFQVEGGPDWVSSARFEVNAKAATPPGVPLMRLMVRRLLAERFALKTHVETSERRIYELVRARRDERLGPNLKPAAVDCVPFLTGRRPMQESPVDPDVGFPLCSSGARMSAGLLTPRLNGQPISALVRLLETQLGRRVVDKTGIEGNFDVELTFVDEGMPMPPGAERRDGPALFTALQEQLGLKLEPARGPVDILVIDHAEQPTAD